MKMVTLFNLTPWTRFPIPNTDGVFDGHFLKEKFQAWWNPTAHKAISCVNDQIKGFMVEENEALLPNYHSTTRTCRYEKFWLTVYVLYEWVTCKHGVDDMTLQTCISVYYFTKQYIDQDKGPRAKCTVADLLGPETERFRTLFREFRMDLNLDDTQKNELMNFLINKKREVVEWFKKMDHLRTRKSETPAEKRTLLQWTPDEYTAFTRQTCTHENLRQKLEDNLIGIHFAQGGGQDDNLHTREADASAVLLELCKEKGGGVQRR
jgi:hypothetical protein